MKYILAYGSLRKGQYNYDYFDKFYKIKKEGTYTIEGYDMYSLGTYPAVIKGKGEIVVDLISIDNEGYDLINKMEIFANYRPVRLEFTVFKTFKKNKIYDTTLYIYNNKIENGKKITSGDWVESNS